MAAALHHFRLPTSTFSNPESSSFPSQSQLKFAASSRSKFRTRCVSCCAQVHDSFLSLSERSPVRQPTISVSDGRLSSARPRLGGLRPGPSCWREASSSGSSSRVGVWGFRGEDLLFLLSDNDAGGPIELPYREIDPLAIPQATTPQIIASTLLTGAIIVLSIRALRRRATRSKNMQFRSSGVATSQSLKEESKKAALNILKKAPVVQEPPPSPIQTLFGAVVAGVIAFGLYGFTTTVETGFNAKAVSQDYSIRNLTITVRTIVTGSCYLATFVFAANSIGLTLYAFQILLGLGDPAAPNESVQKEEPNIEDKSETDDTSNT